MDHFTTLQREALAQHLRKHIQGEVRFDTAARRLYSTDASIYQIEPLGVVIPRTVQDIVALVQFALETKVSLTSRGGGTSLSGQSIGPGIVIDCSKYLNRILEIDTQGSRARVQPGVVLDQLNRALQPHGFQFGPEVSTASRACLGGMIGNNSAGSRSIVYGKTIDHVRALDVVLSDGRPARFGSLSLPEWESRARMPSREGQIYSAVRRIALENEAEIEQRFPRIIRRVSGYNLDRMADTFRPDNDKPSANLCELLVGSEGTLGITTEAEIGIIHRPKHRGLLVPHFASLADSMAALATCLEYQPTAVELMDEALIVLARNNLAMREQMQAIEGTPAALFMVEFCSEDAQEVADRVAKLAARLRGGQGITALVPALDPALRDSLWNLRVSALPLLFGMIGDRKPTTFIEDTAVAPERLPEFVARFREILRRHNTEGTFYGHASVGCLHIRPVLNLKNPEEVQRMRRITEEITDLVLEFGGALSGEHGDGLARSEWNRKMFGPVVYDAFCEVKYAFDPDNVFNPGKVVDAPLMTEQLRFAPGYQPYEPSTTFDYSRQQGFVRAIEMCNGPGVCRKTEGGAMCPSYRATRDEKDSTRGRANGLRLALANEQPLKELRSRWLHDVLDLCLMCKACKSECPSNVDMAKLKAEYLELIHQGRPRPLGHLVMARVDLLNRLGAPVAPLVNWLQNSRPARWLLDRFAGLDRRRSLPELHWQHLRRWFARHAPHPHAGKHGRVLLLDDCFTTFNEPEIGIAAVRVLERAGYAVELAGLDCCTRPMISKGFLRLARGFVSGQAGRLAARLNGDVSILGLEPSCLLTLADEWTELAPNADTKQIAARAEMADLWLANRAKAGKSELTFSSRDDSCLLHVHCHQRALRGVKGAVQALELVPGLGVREMDAGCCGMAGSFGYERDHYEISTKIAGLQLLPQVNAEPDSLVVASGTSCRHQIRDLAQRKALHPMQVLDLASQDSQ